MIIGYNELPTLMTAMGDGDGPDHYPIIHAMLKIEENSHGDALMVVYFDTVAPFRWNDDSYNSMMNQRTKDYRDALMKELFERFSRHRLIFEIDGELSMPVKGITHRGFTLVPYMEVKQYENGNLEVVYRKRSGEDRS